MNNIIYRKNTCLSHFQSNRNATEEEFDNFMHRVTEVDKIIKKLASTNVKEQEFGMLLADEILEKKVKTEILENVELKIIKNRTIINKYSAVDSSLNHMSQEAFKQSVERDAKARAEDRKIRNERAQTFKQIGNSAFKQGNYEKAITYFSKALEQKNDSALLWNNRAVSYMKLGFYEKGLHDCEWALKINKNNIKALLNSAKCYKHLGNDEKYKKLIFLAKKRNPNFQNYITDFENHVQAK